MLKIKRALISVWDKRGLYEFARGLKELGVEIISTGGTAKFLKEKGIPIQEVSEYTGFPEVLEGRVKTLHPRIHAGILMRRDNPQDLEEMKREKIKPIDMVVVNFYPFGEVIEKAGVTRKEVLENIDIGGPTMLRAAAKNYRWVAPVIDPTQYEEILKELKETGGLQEETLLRLAYQVFEKTSSYDGIVADYFSRERGEDFPPLLNLSFQKVSSLRYGENPHQGGAFYREENPAKGTFASAEKLWGKELSFNNFLDLEAALELVKEFEEPTVVVIKHTNPCGVGSASTLKEAFSKAWEGDPVSRFGSILGLNRILDPETAEEIASPQHFIEAIIAPGYKPEALEILKNKPSWGKSVRILKVSPLQGKDRWEIKKIGGGILLQEKDRELLKNLKVVSKRKPSPQEMEDLLFAWKVVKHVKSNAIVLARGKKVVGVGAGQMSRVDASFMALHKAKERAESSVLASDAFFPFPDALEIAARAKITASIEPGGAKRDEEVIKVADKYGISLVFTEMRHFKH